jgi:hypothetical protein
MAVDYTRTTKLPEKTTPTWREQFEAAEQRKGKVKAKIGRVQAKVAKLGDGATGSTGRKAKSRPKP